MVWLPTRRQADPNCELKLTGIPAIASDRTMNSSRVARAERVVVEDVLDALESILGKERPFSHQPCPGEAWGEFEDVHGHRRQGVVPDANGEWENLSSSGRGRFPFHARQNVLGGPDVGDSAVVVGPQVAPRVGMRVTEANRDVGGDQ